MNCPNCGIALKVVVDTAMPTLTPTPTPATRVSNAAASGYAFIVPAYSTINAFGPGQSFILEAVDHVQYYASPTAVPVDLPINASARAKWYGAVLVFFEGNRIVAMSPPLLTKVTIRQFAEYASIDDMGEADIEASTLALCGTTPQGKYEIFLYDLLENTKRTLSTLDVKPESIYATPDARTIVSTVNPSQMTLYPAGPFLPAVDPHKDVCLFNGKPVLLWCNSDTNPVVPAGWNNALVMTDLTTGTATGILSFPWDIAFHISGCDHGFCIVSTYQAAGTPESQYSNAIIKVPLDGSAPTVLCKHGSVLSSTDPGLNYEAQPHATVSPDGKKVLYASNMGGAVVDTYLLAVG